ncbi:unnamed protein product [Sympodiomycopsis kandeliae]
MDCLVYQDESAQCLVARSFGWFVAEIVKLRHDYIPIKPKHHPSPYTHFAIAVRMGRKSQPPPSAGNGRVGTKKQDTGLPSFFKHRKQQQQQQAQQQGQGQGQSSPHGNNGKGKRPSNSSQQVASSTADLAASIRNASAGNVAVGIVDPSASLEGTGSFSPYEHLSQGGFHGGTKDSSVKAYGRHLRSLIEQSDVLIQVLDARDPMGSRSITSENLLLSHPGKKLLLVLTKIDLVPKNTLQSWLIHLRQFHPTLAFKSTSTLSASGRSSRKLYTQTALTAAGGAITSLEASSSATLLQLLKNYARSQPKGMSLTVGIFGPPNVGKSSLINSLVRSRACSVAPRPGETKTLQTVLLDRKVRLIDSPGVAIPNSATHSIEGQTAEVLRGTVKVELVEDPITPIAEILKRADPVKVTKLYGLPEIELEEEEEQETPAEQMHTSVSTQMAVEAGPSSTGSLPAKKVDFDTMRGESSDDEEMDRGDADSDDEDDYHRDDFQDDAVEGDTETTSRTRTTTAKRRGPVGYDASDPMDFLLRLALTKGKMLRGGRPDVEGAARGVITDWNSGKISWFVKAPLASTSVEARKEKRAEKKDEDEQMAVAAVDPQQSVSEETQADGKRVEDAKTEEDPTVVSGFSQAFDLDALFAQADAQMFGGAEGTTGKSAEANTPPQAAVPAAAKKNLEAGDVSKSSLGKRGRVGDDSDDEEAIDIGEEGNDSSDDSDNDEQRDSNRMTMPAPTAADVEDTMEVAGGSVKGKRGANRPQGEDELSAFLSSSSNQDKSKPRDGRIAHHIAAAQSDVGMQNGSNTGGGVKRGQRNKGKKKNASHHNNDDDDMPSYLARQQHKATLPVNIKKTHINTDDICDDIGVGRGTTSKKQGQDRKKKRKMARREDRQDGSGGVWRELGEVTLD